MGSRRLLRSRLPPEASLHSLALAFLAAHARLGYGLASVGSRRLLRSRLPPEASLHSLALAFLAAHARLG